ncbi:6-phosphogluconate dehydrogenase C-terminal domain-like protein [Trametes coccinea BRFM310]|uniref:6-phosphogluconate dehydrogenase C-terminal domain-like protein n=1 Tax=Trametes coccinea (strain BRFM310) TaxID=1353009 RepID=A0A1Y2I6B5_TRAC3|nr:6-phosphogluconate dehydrogenase C-terminal domain-like protein [Trametes coccinea BRFM310]
MASQLKDVLLIGYGAVGAVYSLILKRSSLARVTVVARGNYEAANARGMEFRSRKYGNIQGWRPDRLFSSIEKALDRPYTYVVLASKAIPEIQRTPALLKPLLSPPYADAHPQPTYVLFQNGLNVEVDLYEALKALRPEEEPRILSTANWIATGLVEKNVVEHGEFDRVSIGVYRPGTAPAPTTKDQSVALADFAHILAVGGSEVSVVPEIQRVKFAKNLWNGVLGASAALSRCSLRAFFRPPHLEPGREGTEPTLAERAGEDAREVREARETPSARATAAIPRASPAVGAYTIPFLHDTLTEVYELGRVLFPPQGEDVPGLDPEVVQKTLANTARLHARPDSVHVPSMLVDVRAGRPMEVEHVVGEVVRMGRRAGVSMPRMETLYALLLVMQNEFLRKQQEGKAQL